MTDVIAHIETDVRERIFVTAERLFREIGYRKTAVADIARALRMSSADIYRLSDSEKSINADVAHRLMWEVETSQLSPRANGHRAIARAAETAHRMNSDRYASNSKMHEMASAVMEENWDVCKAHLDCIIGVTAPVIADRVTSDEFHAPGVGNSPPLSSARQRRAPWKKQ